MTIKNGDMPAMPYAPVTSRDIGTGVIIEWKNYVGLTKREQFAMAAMQGILSHYGSGDVSHGGAAWDAVKCADALLTELEK